MTEQEFYTYINNPHNYEMVNAGLDLARWHFSLEYVFEESIRCGREKDVDAMKFIIDNNVNIGTLCYMHSNITIKEPPTNIR